MVTAGESAANPGDTLKGVGDTPCAAGRCFAEVCYVPGEI